METTLIDARCKDIDFGELYISLWDKMLNVVCRKYTSDISKAQDYCQNGFVKVYNNISKYDGEGPLEAWVKCVINNNIIDELKKSKIEICDGGDEGFDFSMIKSSEDEYEESEYSISKIMEVLKYLSPVYKKVFELYYLEGLPHNEISEKLGISTNTSKTNLMKAKKNIKKYLQNGVPHSKINK
jgi:RNA polymerase sigma-70 factor, ECF subfamily